jgi:hypothetical protein
MLNKNLKKALVDNLPSKNVEALICFMENAGVKYYMADLRGPLALATYYGVYIDLNTIKNRGLSEMLIYFIIFHETAHMKRIKRMGKKLLLKNLSTTDFDLFFEHVLGEELVADRYGCYMYYNLTKKVYPKYMTQQLDIKENAERYKGLARQLYGQVDNDENKYKELINKFIRKKY